MREEKRIWRRVKTDMAAAGWCWGWKWLSWLYGDDQLPTLPWWSGIGATAADREGGEARQGFSASYEIMTYNIGFSAYTPDLNFRWFAAGSLAKRRGEGSGNVSGAAAWWSDFYWFSIVWILSCGSYRWTAFRQLLLFLMVPYRTCGRVTKNRSLFESIHLPRCEKAFYFYFY